MTEKRYYYRDYEELYYIFDSNTISEKEFDEKEEYEGYTAFEDSLSSEEIVNLLNENEQLKIKLEDIALDMENAKESNDDAQYELYKIKKENEQLKSVLKEIVRVSEYNGAISPMRVKSMTYNFIGDLND